MRANGPKDLPDSSLNFITASGPLLDLRCDRYGKATLCCVRWQNEHEKVLGVKLTPFFLASIDVGFSSKPGAWSELSEPRYRRPEFQR